MEQLSQLQAQSTQKITTLPTITQYSLLKILLNKDYLAKNQLGDKFLLCLSKTKHDCSPQQLVNTHIICSVDTFTEESQRYEVFPLAKKLFWAGDRASLQQKSELYCLSVLYSALKYILKPLLNITGAYQLTKCICLQNLWFRSSSAFLFLCNRHKDRLSLKTEMRNKKTINQFEIQQDMLQRTGQIFWEIFCVDNNANQNNNRTTFRQIVKMMVKGQTSLNELEQIMEDKLAKRKFISSLTKKYIIDTEELVQNKQTIDENMLSKLENIPVKTGKIYHGLHFDRRKSLQPRQQNHRYLKLNSLCQEDELIPPSFTHSKRKKRFSLFSANKMPYRTLSVVGKDNQSITVSIQRNEIRNQNIESKNKKEMVLKYSLDINGTMSNWKDGKQPKSKPKSIERKRDLKRFFDQINSLQNKAYYSRLEVMSGHSKEKALAIFKKSIECDTISEDKLIDDKLFVANLRVKRSQYKQNLQRSIVKVCEQMNMKPSSKQQNQAYNQANHQSNQNGRQLRMISNIGKCQNVKNMPKQQLVSNVIKQQIASTTPKLQVSQRGSRQSDIIEQKVFNEAVLAEQKATLSVVNERDVIDFSLENKNEQKINQRGKSKVSIVQSILQQQDSTVAAKQTIQKQITQRQQESFSVETKQQHFPRYESQVELLPLSKVDKNNHIQPYKIPTTKYKQHEKQMLVSPRSPSKIANKTEQTIKIPSKQELRDKSETKQRDMEEENRENFSFAAVHEAKINEVQEIKSFISANNKKATATEVEAKTEKEIKAQKAVRKEPKSVKNIKPVLEDEIEEITLVSNIAKKAHNPIQKETKQSKFKHENKSQAEAKPQIQQNPKIQAKVPVSQTLNNSSNLRKRSTQSEKQQKEVQVQKEEKQKPSKPERLKTGQSNASSNGNKSVKKQIEEYIFMINKMGEAVAKTSKLSKKLQKIDWFTGVYYLYKRFFFERKKIEKYLTNNEPKLTRHGPFSEEDWNQWLKKGQIEVLLAKCIEDNANIEKSIKKMMKKLQSQQLPATILLNAPLNKNIEDSSRIAVQYVVDEYDQLEEQGMLNDPQLSAHICQMVNALYVMAELDGKVKEKRPVIDYSNTKRSKEEVSRMVQVIFDVYQQQ